MPYLKKNSTRAGIVGMALFAAAAFAQGPAAPVLTAPANSAIGQPLSLTLSWNVSTGATSYSMQLSTASTFATTVTEPDRSGGHLGNGPEFVKGHGLLLEGECR